MLPQFLPGQGGEIGGRHVKDGLAARLALPVHAAHRPGVGHQHRGGELRVGVQLQAILDDVVVCPAGFPGVDHKAPVGDAAVVPLQLLLGDKVDGGVIVGKIVGHGDDLPLNAGQVGPLLRHYKALPGVLLAGGQLRRAPRPDSLQGLGHGDGVLPGVLHPVDPADGVGVPLADPLPPEGVALPLGQDGLGQQAVQGEHPRVPAHGNGRHLAAGLGRGVHLRKMLGDVGVGVKAVHHIKQPGELGCLLGQVRGTAAA